MSTTIKRCPQCEEPLDEQQSVAIHLRYDCEVNQ